MLNFAWLAKVSTSQRPGMFGILPTYTTLFALLIAAAALASGASLMLAAGVWMGAIASTIPYLSLFGITTLALIGYSLGKFWFSREITTFSMSTREVRNGFDYSQKHNPTNVRQMVEHLRQEVNAYFRKELGNKHRDIPMPRLLTFTDDAVKIVTTEGRNPGKAAIVFSSGTFLYKKNNLDQRQLAALIEVELVKIYLQKGSRRTIVNIGAELFSSLDSLTTLSFSFLPLQLLTWPYLLVSKFIQLLEHSIHRSFEYEAALYVAEKFGRGVDLIKAIDSKVCSTLETLPTNAELKADQSSHKREPYKGPFQWLLRPIADWIDNNEYAGDDKTGYRIVSMFDIFVREGGYIFNEWMKNEPRATNLKNALRPVIKTKIDGKDVSMDTAYTKDIKKIRKHDIQLNQKLHKYIPLASRYAVIGPEGTGYLKPIAKKPVIFTKMPEAKTTKDALSAQPSGILKKRRSKLKH